MAKYDLSYPKAYRLVKVLKARTVVAYGAEWAYYFETQTRLDYAKALLFMYSIPFTVTKLELRGTDPILIPKTLDMEDCPIDALIN